MAGAPAARRALVPPGRPQRCTRIASTRRREGAMLFPPLCAAWEGVEVLTFCNRAKFRLHDVAARAAAARRALVPPGRRQRCTRIVSTRRREGAMIFPPLCAVWDMPITRCPLTGCVRKCARADSPDYGYLDLCSGRWFSAPVTSCRRAAVHLILLLFSLFRASCVQGTRPAALTRARACAPRDSSGCRQQRLFLSPLPGTLWRTL